MPVIGWKIYVIIGLSAILVAGGLAWYIRNLQDDIATLKRDNDALALGLSTQIGFTTKYEKAKQANDAFVTDLMQLSDGMDDHDTPCAVPASVRDIIGRL